MREPRESLDVTTSVSSSSAEKNALQRYLQENENVPVLTPSEERELALRARHGDATAQKELVRRNLRFVVTVARQYARHGVPLEDLINEGNIGLMRATARFDPARGFLVEVEGQEIGRAVHEDVFLAIMSGARQ